MSIIGSCPSSAKIRSILREAVFGPRPFCPRCGSSKVFRTESRYRCPRCRRPFSIRSVSWLKGAKLSDRKLWILLVCWQRRIALGTATSVAGVSLPTVRRWYRLFQEHLVYESPLLLGVVEVDEAFQGKRRHRNQTPIIGGISREQNCIVLRTMERYDQETSDRFLLRHIQTGSAIWTDGSSLYEGIDAFFQYPHLHCNHSAWYFGPTNHIEAVWSALKRFIRRTYHHLWKEHLPMILREFEARWNSPELFASPSLFLTTSLLAVPTAC